MWVWPKTTRCRVAPASSSSSAGSSSGENPRMSEAGEAWQNSVPACSAVAGRLVIRAITSGASAARWKSIASGTTALPAGMSPSSPASQRSWLPAIIATGPSDSSSATVAPGQAPNAA